MRALSYQGPYKLEVVNKPEPRIEHPQDAILRVTRAAICGSDLHLYHGLIADCRIGHTFGHEFTGVIEELGSDVDNLQVGDRVVVPFPIACGVCWFCQRGFFANCAQSNPSNDLVAGVFGYSHTTGGYDGGQAEYVRVPYANVGPMKIPDDMDDESVLFLSDIMPTGYQAAEMGQIAPGDTVVVFGCGPVGLFTMRSAWLMGAGRVIAVDHVPYRLEFAERYAQVETLDFKKTDVILAIKEMTDGRGADVCVDAVGLEAAGSVAQKAIGVKGKMTAGSTAALDMAIHATRKGGNVSIIGVYGPPGNLLDIGSAMNKGLTLRMNQCNVHRYLPHLLDHVRAGRIEPKGIITHRLAMEDVPRGYEMFSRKLDGCIKCVIDPRTRA